MTSVDTSTTSAAKEHARAQSGVVTDSMPVVPASSWPTPPADIDPALLTWAETVPGGRYTTKVLGRGTRLRLRDLDGRACAHLLLYRADAPWERLNVADTVKVPWQAYLGAGHPLLSDQGACSRRSCRTGPGGTTPCAAPHRSPRTPRDTVTAACIRRPRPAVNSSPWRRRSTDSKRRDLPPSLSFFHGVRVGEDGSLSSIGSAGADTAIDLVIHLPVIVLIANTAHPLDPSPTYDTTALEVLAWTGADVAEPVDADPEYRRAFLNTEDVWAAAQRQGREQA